MKYKCVKGFSLEYCDGDGFMIENQYIDVKVNGVWEKEEDPFRVAGGEVRLVSDEENNWQWIEISKERFEECFEQI